MTIDITIHDCEMDDLAPWLIKALEKKAARKTPKVEDIPVLEPDLPPLQEIPKPDLEAVRSVMNNLKNEKGIETVKKLLSRFGVKRVPDIPENQYEAVLEAAAQCYTEEG